jgi:phospholipase C
MNFSQQFLLRQSRRHALKRLGAFTLGLSASAGLGTGTLTAIGRAAASAPAPAPAENPLKHILILCQENRSFDTYFGYYERAGRFAVPANYSQPGGAGKPAVKPYHFSSYTNHDIPHSWQALHAEWNGGKMDGFVTTDGLEALGYYTRSDLPYYYALADAFTLCGNYFCYQLGPTLPNRLALWSGTSGGITNNRPGPGSLDWPTIADLLDQHGVSWQSYNLNSHSRQRIGSLNGFNGLAYFKRWIKDARLYGSEDDYYQALADGTLPQVVFLITSSEVSEHPPSNVRTGEKKVAEIINALIASRYWSQAAFILTYDENGGYFDHIAPPQLDAYGLGMRVPTLIISPWVKRGYVAGQLYEHSSVLKFIERTFGLPTLASLNHQFDDETPTSNNDAAAGRSAGPPAPPRDGLAQIGDLYEVFDFSQDPHYYPPLPPAP